jgi:hypothetical protein
MGSMSSSDAAPLPRLGEVFFDVRGNSRSMRLSWYADTGVAVLSIWQGGMCTGTFRLAIADLPRMVQTLQRGPGGPGPEWDAGAPAAGAAGEPEPGLVRMRAMPPLPGEDVLAESEGPRTGAAEYLAGPADDPRSASTQYLAPPGDYPADPPDHRAARPDYLADPPDHRAPAPPDYLADPPDHRAPAPPDYLADPPDHRADRRDYPADRRDYPADPPGNYLTGPAHYREEPPGHRPEYLADLPGPSEIGPDALRPGGPGAWNPGADRSSYPRDRRAPADYPEGPYPGGSGRTDYQGEPPAMHYQPGSSAPGDGDALGRSAADYPAHYANTVTDDDPLGPSPDSFPYARPPGARRTASRHAAPDVPFD